MFTFRGMFGSKDVGDESMVSMMVMVVMVPSWHAAVLFCQLSAPLERLYCICMEEYTWELKLRRDPLNKKSGFKRNNIGRKGVVHVLRMPSRHADLLPWSEADGRRLRAVTAAVSSFMYLSKLNVVRLNCSKLSSLASSSRYDLCIARLHLDLD